MIVSILLYTATDSIRPIKEKYWTSCWGRGEGELLFVSYKTTKLTQQTFPKLKTKLHKFTNAQTILVHFVFQTAVTDQYETQIECRKYVQNVL